MTRKIQFPSARSPGSSGAWILVHWQFSESGVWCMQSQTMTSQFSRQDPLLSVGCRNWGSHSEVMVSRFVCVKHGWAIYMSISSKQREECWTNNCLLSNSGLIWNQANTPLDISSLVDCFKSTQFRDIYWVMVSNWAGVRWKRSNINSFIFTKSGSFHQSGKRDVDWVVACLSGS